MMGRFVCPDDPGSHNSLDVGRWYGGFNPARPVLGERAKQLTIPGPSGLGRVM